jgi:hypothetical protein
LVWFPEDALTGKLKNLLIQCLPVN